jgi:nucleoid-associated protein YgaU
MSNKDQQKMDGVFETSSEKAASKPDRPARPAKSKAPLTRETKVGLAVIAALLVIFVVVLVVRLRRGSEEPVAKGPASSKGSGTEKSAKDQPKTTPPESRTLIANPTDSRAPWSGASSTSANGFAAGSTGNGKGNGAARTNLSGSAYSGLANANDKDPARGTPPTGYLPPNIQQGSRIGFGAADLHGASGIDQTPIAALHGSPPAAQKQTAAAIDPFAAQPRIGIESASSSSGDEAVASDETIASDEADIDVDNVTAAQASAATGDPFGRRATGQIDAGLDQAPVADVKERSGDLQQRTATPRKDLTHTFDRKNVNDTDPGEASRFVPKGLSVPAGVDRFAGNEFEASTPDNRIEANDVNRIADSGKLTLPTGSDTSSRKQNLATAEKDLPTDSKSPFRKSFQSAAAPARLDDAAFEGNGQSPAPIQGPEAAALDSAYTVAAGDTYWTIAKKTYDSGAYFKALYEHNRRQSPSATTLRPGMKLVLPDEATLQRLYPTLCPRPQRVAAAPRVTPTSATLDNDGQEHVVSEGDTLYDVARRRLGNTKRWAEIYELNREAIGAPGDRLEPGTRLVLPQ